MRAIQRRTYGQGLEGDLFRRIGRELLCPVHRWTPYRKLHVIEGIAAGYVTEAEAMAPHGISEEELGTWKRRARGGSAALAEDAFLVDRIARENRARQLAAEIVRPSRRAGAAYGRFALNAAYARTIKAGCPRQETV